MATLGFDDWFVHLVVIIFFMAVYTGVGLYIIRPIIEGGIRFWAERVQHKSPEGVITVWRYIGVILFVLAYPAVILTVMFYQGTFSLLTTELGITWSITLGAIIYIGGSKFAQEFLSGGSILIADVYKIGDHVEGWSDYKKMWEGWVTGIGTHKTGFIDEDGNWFPIFNDKVKHSYLVNHDRAPFRMATVEVSLPEGNPVQHGIALLDKVKDIEGDVIYTPNPEEDKDWYADSMGEVAAERLWERISKPGVHLIGGQQAILKVPVKSYFDELKFKDKLIEKGVISNVGTASEQPQPANGGTAE